MWLAVKLSNMWLCKWWRIYNNGGVNHGRKESPDHNTYVDFCEQKSQLKIRGLQTMFQVCATEQLPKVRWMCKYLQLGLMSHIVFKTHKDSRSMCGLTIAQDTMRIKY